MIDYPNPHPVHGIRPLAGDHPNPEVWSNMTVRGVRITWREAHAHLAEELARYAGLFSVMSDLNRCEHGRHEGDSCRLSGGHCGGGVSRGNPLMAQGVGTNAVFDLDGEVAGTFPVTERQIGFGIDRRPIVVPPRGSSHDPDAWRA